MFLSPKVMMKPKLVLERFTPFFSNEKNIEKVGQNLKYDIKVLKKYAMQVKGPLFDTMIAHYLINPDMRHNMECSIGNLFALYSYSHRITHWEKREKSRINA